jgi:transcriptional regulatory protein RtcR
MNEKRNIAFSLLGASLDAGKGPDRWSKWRPTVALCQHENLIVSRLELIYQPKFKELAELILGDVSSVSPETETCKVEVGMDNPWDFEEVYAALHDFARSYQFDTEKEDYLVHITTGSHVAQICLFLLTESRHFPAKLIQTSPPARRGAMGPGTFETIDLDLSKYDRIASRFKQEQKEGASFLKSGIETRNPEFNRLIDRIEKVAISSRDPLLLIGPTGAGKSRLAKRIYELKRARHQVEGDFVEVNCATLRGDAAMSALFGHVKGAFTGAVRDRPGLLKAANKGVLFLDEVGTLGLDEQAMLLRALEEKVFLPMGGDRETNSEFQLIAGTNSDLFEQVREGRFREDLLARINLWTFRLPGLRERVEDIEPNLQYELDQFARRIGQRVTLNKEARDKFLRFAISSEAAWAANFRDLNAAIVRMATLAQGGRISAELVDEEIARLRSAWRPEGERGEDGLVAKFAGSERAVSLDLFESVQLEAVLKICRQCRTLSDAGRKLFSASRDKKKTTNDADRLRKYLVRYGIEWRRLWEAGDD